MARTIDTPVDVCESCGKELDRAAHAADRVPSPGDISICFRCGHLTAFDENLRHRPLTDEELADFGEPFSQYRSRAFTLPHISVAGILPGANKLIDPLQRLDGAVLKRFPSLDYYATVRVIEMVK